MRKCETCYYYSRNSKTCSYLLITGETRDCSPLNCDKYMTLTAQNCPKQRVQVPKQKPMTVKAPAGPPGWPKPDFNKLKELYQQGLNDKEIGAIMRRQPATIRGWRKQAGLPGPGTGNYRRQPKGGGTT